MQNIKPAKSLSEILDAKDDASFLSSAYITLLRRSPDPEGFTYYSEKLAGGKARRKILIEIASSSEGRSMAVSLPGLEKMMKYQYLRNLFVPKKKASIVDLPKEGGRQVNSNAGVIVKSDGYDHVCMRAKYIPREDFYSNIYTRHKRSQRSKIWFDLTCSMEWSGGVVGIVRAELEVAAGLKKNYPEVGFVVSLGKGFVEIPHNQLDWLFSAKNVAEAYIEYFSRGANKNSNPEKVHVSIPADEDFYHPFADGDAVIAMGWMDSNKEVNYEKVKRELESFYICYLVYDTILLNDETRRFYSEEGRNKFGNYLRWISEHADFILYGGKTAKDDAERIQKERGWSTPAGLAVKFGTDIFKKIDNVDEKSLLRKIGVTGDFIITVGSIEPRKNHDTLYRAYLYALENSLEMPQLVICGKPMSRTANLMETLARDPRIQGKIIHLTPSEQELALLYKHCIFTVLPSLYEGWSLTLPESLGQGKFCIATNTPSLKEIGSELVDFVDDWDVKGWAELISNYAGNKNKLAEREHLVRKKWPVSTWSESARSIYQGVSNYVESNPAKKLKPEIWIDLTTSYLFARDIGGIVRAELALARHIYQQNSDVHFFAFDRGNFFEIKRDLLLWLLNDHDITQQYYAFHDYWAKKEGAGEAYRNPFATGVYPGHPDIIQRFPADAIFMFFAIDTASGYLSRNQRIVEIVKNSPKAMLVQLIYDFTPVLFPQLHMAETCEPYLPFVKHAYNEFDLLIFGGKTAMKDGERLRSEAGWKKPQTEYIEFGSDVGSGKLNFSLEEDKTALKKFGITGNFVMTVGTIEPRKNHEMLYKAFLTLRKRGFKNLPQLVIVGKPGWKTEDFRAILEDDDRVTDLIKVIRPNDEELAALYRNCQFTLLPSFYEGWSLTLPESLGYGKFCLSADNAPLRETGRDLVEYINPLDTIAWADRIAFYVDHPDALSAKESRIRQEWKSKTWKECSKELLEKSLQAYQRKMGD